MVHKESLRLTWKDGVCQSQVQVGAVTDERNGARGKREVNYVCAVMNL